MGIWHEDNRMDYYEIMDERVKKNSNCVAAILKKDLIEAKNGFSTLKVKNYGKIFNLDETEAFRDQSVIPGSAGTVFLVKKDVVATAAQCVIGKKITDLRIVFGYKMLAPTTPVIQMSNENIYNCVEIISLVYNLKGNKASWALVQLDREAQGKEVALLSKKDTSPDQHVYVIGHPMGLPLKYAAGARVRGLDESLFKADLDIYMGNGGSPVFSADTHQVVGIVTQGYPKDLRWTGKGWNSIIYTNRDIDISCPKCTRISELTGYIGSGYTDIDRKQIFISYSHIDKIYLDRLMVHLRPLERYGLIKLWADTKLKSGDKWKIEIENALKRARAAILLVSADFLASGFIVDNELPPLLKKAESDGTKIIPVILGPCGFSEDENLSIFQPTNDPSKPLMGLTKIKKEEIYYRLAKDIKVLMDNE